MSSAGHVFDMINRLKQNQNLVKSRRQKMSHLREVLSHSSPYKNNEFHEKKIPPEVMRKIKSDIRRKIKHDRQKAVILSISTFILLCALVYIIVLLFLN